MSYHHQSYAFFLVQSEQNVQHDMSISSIEITRRLVQKQHLRSIGQRSSNSDSLLLATRQLIRIVLQSMRHSH